MLQIEIAVLPKNCKFGLQAIDMKNTFIIATLLLSFFCKAQDLKTSISLFESKDYINAIKGFNAVVSQSGSQDADYFAARYYLGKTIFDMVKKSGGTPEYHYNGALENWKFVLKNDKSNTWLPKIEADIVQLIELSCTGKDNKVDSQKETAIYKELLEIVPGNPVLLFGMGEAHDHGNNHLVAFNYYTQAIKANIDKRDEKYKKTAALSNLRIAEHKLFKSNTYGEALSYARYGLALDPDNLELQTVEALALFKSGDKENGLKKFEAILARHPDNKYVKDKYSFLLEHTQPDKAAEQYEALLKSNPDNTRALFFLGEYYTGKATDIFNTKGATAEVQSLMLKGIDNLEKYRKLKPEDKEVARSLIKFYDNLRMTEKADALRKESGE
jgi:tetratricopeptide (TPR) repeat protein